LTALGTLIVRRSQSPRFRLAAARRWKDSALLVASIAAVAAPAAPAQAYAETWVAYRALLAEVESGPLIRAIINPTRHDVEIKFRNLAEWHAFYPAAEQPELQRLLRARHVRVLFVPRALATKVKPAVVHHTLRYVLAAIVFATVLAGGALHVWRRRSAALTRARARA
jgi:hypothetical protein